MKTLLRKLAWKLLVKEDLEFYINHVATVYDLKKLQDQIQNAFAAKYKVKKK